MAALPYQKLSIMVDVRGLWTGQELWGAVHILVGCRFGDNISQFTMMSYMKWHSHDYVLVGCNFKKSIFEFKIAFCAQ